ncbi:GNAT family N-acetyltransferase [Flavobacteriales bacterium]|nr:GNAT family N-acetyltransferase [Flavobacteriales bacterium]
MSLSLEIKHYKECSLDEFHDIISLRIEIFSVEQKVFYNDLDGYDKDAFHIIGRDLSGKIIATARILKPGAKYEKTSFGRVVIDKPSRGKGYGHEMVKFMNNFIAEDYPNSGCKISAMLYLKEFYETHGYKKTSDVYPDCGIDHIDMEIEAEFLK